MIKSPSGLTVNVQAEIHTLSWRPDAANKDAVNELNDKITSPKNRLAE
jgi:hypothetical protein